MEKGLRGESPGLTGRPWQDEGELCLNSIQCKSKCCHRPSGLSLARCAPKASEKSECSIKVSAGGLGGVVLGGEGDSPKEKGLRGLRVGSGGRVIRDLKCQREEERGVNRLQSTFLSHGLSRPSRLTSEKGGSKDLLSPFHGWANRGPPERSS